MNGEDADDLTKIETAGPKSLPASTDALFGMHSGEGGLRTQPAGVLPSGDQ
jgi:hypothetical protein